MVTCSATLNTLASTYAGLGSFVGLATASPGATASPSGEATGGSPAYARLATTWSAGSVGVQNGTAVSLNCSAASYSYMLLASSSSGNAMVDNVGITTVVLGSQGVIIVTPQFTQT